MACGDIDQDSACALKVYVFQQRIADCDFGRGNRAIVDGVAGMPGVASLNRPSVRGDEADAASYDSH